MTVERLLQEVDALRPNAFTAEQKTAWLNEVEGKIQSEIFLFAPPQVLQYDAVKDRHAELLAAPPHDQVYRSYLCALIDFGNGEYAKYNNSLQLFNAQYTEFMRWFAKNYRPADG